MSTRPTIGAVIRATGTASTSPIMAAEIVHQFGSFDDLVEAADDYLPDLLNAIAAREHGGDSSCVIYLAGWLSREERPAAYCN